MSKPIRVLHVIGKRPQGGIGAFLLNVHRRIDIEKVQFDYLINADENEGFFDKEVKKLGGKVYLLPELSYKNTFKYLIQLNKFLKQHREYNIIHGHSVNIGVFYFSLAKMYGIKNRIAHSHSTKYSNSKINSMRNFILQIPLKLLANHYFACSKEAGIFLYGKRAIKNNKVYIIKNAIECEEFRYNLSIREDIRKELGINNEIVIGNVGRFSKEKNHSFMLDIFSEINKKNSQSKLVLVGDGPLLEECKKKAEKLNIYKDVIFLGRRNDINKILQAIDVFILTSYFEGFGISLIEAQATGLLTFASDVVPEEVQVTENIHLLSIEKSPKDWADEINNKLEIFIRTDQSEVIKRNGFDIKIEVDKLEKYYIALNM